MIDPRTWFGQDDDDENDPVKRTLRYLGMGVDTATQAASDIGTGISTAASSAGEALGSGLSSAAEAVSPYLAAPGGGSPVGGGPRRLEPDEPSMLEQLPQVASEYGRAASATLGDRGAMLAGLRPPETPEEVMQANAPAPVRAGRIVSEVGSAAMGAALGEYGERAAGTEPTFVTNEIQTPLGTIPSVEGPTPRQVGSAVGSVVGDPTNWILPGTAADKAADVAIRGLAGAAGQGVRAGAGAAGSAIGRAAEPLIGAFRGNAGRVAAADARMAAEGGTSLPATLGGLPEPGGAVRPTVEVLQERLNTATSAWQRAREAGDERMAALAREHAVDLESQLVDAQNARRSLEPAIRSDIGARVESLPLAEETADTLSGAGSRIASIEGLGGPVSHVPSSINLNAGLGGLPEGGGRRWVPDARYQSGGFWWEPKARVPEELRSAEREYIMRNADLQGARQVRQMIETRLSRAADDVELQHELMTAITREEEAQHVADAAREWVQMVKTGDKTLVSAGAAPETDGGGAGVLSAVNRALGEGIAGGVGGAVIEQGRNPDEDPRTAAARGFAVGAVGFPAATRLARGAARLAGAGDGAARGALGTLGAAPDPDEVADLARRAASTPMTGPHTNGQHVTRNVARQIQKQADAGIPPEHPTGPMAPPNPPPGFWDHVENWRYNVGMFAQLSTGMIQAGGGVIQALGGGAAEALRLGVIRGQGEALPLIAAEGIRSLPGALGSAGRTVLGQVPKAIEAGSDYKPSLHAREFAAGNVGRGVEALLVGTPGRVMTQAPDALWYEFFYRTGLAQAAADQVRRELGGAPLRGLAGGIAGGAAGYESTPEDASPWRRAAQTLGGAVLGGGLASGATPGAIARARRTSELIANPTPEMLEEATKLAQNATYKGEPGIVHGAPKTAAGYVVGKIPSEKVRQGLGVLGSFLMPIYNTIARISEQSLEYKPALGLLPLERGGLAPATQARPMDRRLAQQAVGVSLVLTGLSYAAEGGIRGPGPSDPNQAQAMRDKGYTPETTNVAGFWVPNTWFGPWAGTLNDIGAINDARIYDHGDKAWDDLTWEKKADAVIKMATRASRDYPALDAASTFTKFFSDPTGTLASFLGEVAAQYAPGPIRTKALAEDPLVRTTTRGKDVPFLQRAEETFRQRSGIGRQQLPAAQDQLGRDVVNPRQGLSALAPNVRAEKPDPIIQAYLDADVNIGDPPTELSVGALKPGLAPPELSPEETRRWNTIRGEQIIKSVGDLMAQDTWASRAPEWKKAALEARRTAAGTYATGTLRKEIGEPEVRRRMEERGSRKAAS